MIYEESRWPKQQNKVNEAFDWFEDVFSAILNTLSVRKQRQMGWI